MKWAKLIVLGLALLLAGGCTVALTYGAHKVFLEYSMSFVSRERGFAKAEAEAKIGRRVRVVDCSSLETIWKVRDDRDGGWRDLTIGERGTVKKMEQSGADEYYLIVFWDEPKEEYPYRSYYRKAGQFSVYGECLAEE